LFKQIGSTIKGAMTWLVRIQSSGKPWSMVGSTAVKSWQHREEHIMPTQTLVIDIDWTIGIDDIPQKQ
jgi:hypothetical protein